MQRSFQFLFERHQAHHGLREEEGLQVPELELVQHNLPDLESVRVPVKGLER